MTILQIQYALAVAKYKNFSRAAESLFISQPALSLQIQTLEQELQRALFSRSTHGVSLTAAGQEFCTEAEQLLKEWERFHQKVGPTPKREHLRVGIGPRAVSNGLFEKVAEYFAGHPEVTVTFITDIREHTLEALAEGRMDIAVDRLPPGSFMKHIRLEQYAVEKLLTERQCILMSPNDPHCEQDEYCFQDLHGSSVVLGPEDSADDQVMRSSCKEYGITVGHIYRSDSIETCMNLIRHGKGMTLGPRSFAAYYGVGAVPMDPETYVDLNLICLKRSSKKPYFSGLCAYLKRSF